MQGTAPLLRAKGQAEGGASIQPNGRVEATAAYSPAKYLMLTGGLTGCLRLPGNDFLATRQFEVGAGGYLPLGSHWLLSGVGGYGQAANRRGFGNLGSTLSEYEAHYGKVFGQAGIMRTDGHFSYGASYRLVLVNFTSLSSNIVGKLPLAQMYRHEGLFFTRTAWGNTQRLESIVAAGLGVSDTRPLTEEDVNFQQHATLYDVNRQLLPILVVSWGLIYQPSW